MSQVQEDELLDIIRQLKKEIVERKWAEKKASDALDYAESIIDSVRHPIVVIEEDERIISANMAFFELFSLSPRDVIGKNLFRVANNIFEVEKLRELISSSAEESHYIEIDHDFCVVGRKILNVQMTNLQYNVKHLNFKLLVFNDITEQKAVQAELESMLKQKEILINEMNHRVRNNLQLIESLFSLQVNALPEGADHDLLAKNRDRFAAMVLAHNLAYEEGDLRLVAVRDLVEDIVRRVSSAPGKRIRLSFDMDDIKVELSKAINVSLTLNEIAMNIVQHAFPDGHADPQVAVSLKWSEGWAVIVVRDNGVGFDPGSRPGNGLGLELVKNIVENNLAGSWSMDASEGTVHVIRFIP
jgi:PAS domain S-box-containing protein